MLGARRLARRFDGFLRWIAPFKRFAIAWALRRADWEAATEEEEAKQLQDSSLFCLFVWAESRVHPLSEHFVRRNTVLIDLFPQLRFFCSFLITRGARRERRRRGKNEANFSTRMGKSRASVRETLNETAID